MVDISRNLTRLQSIIRDPFFLLIRIIFGIGIMSHGYSKILDINGTAAYFGSLGLPIPVIAAILSGCTELFGGLALLVGYNSQLASFLLSINMMNAIIWGHKSTWAVLFDKPWELIHLNAFRYLLFAVIIFLDGPGRFSFDYMFRKSAYTKHKTG